ncbi:site-2 protease family protein [Flavobacterium channae]|uniref:site-2 protease family protein n=1 Tax=Flavobacterium channae TaxID=2897181 RepID=UPI001E4F137F|nr:site-2 protease family protein [Flavobacterium channae]UGS23511.1 site-2 protease family protein [Flavobacterium channae]
MIQVAQILFILSVLVILHEFGHYIAAKMFKVRVEKFYLFMDAGFSLIKKKIGETEWGIGWLPLGGYVKLSGMIDESMDTEQMNQEPQPWEFRSKPAWQRLIIMLGGIIVNVILAWLIFTIMYATVGQKFIATEKIQENGLAFGEVGQKAGFKNGDKILSVDGKFQPSFNRMTLDVLLGDNVEVERNGEKVDVILTDEMKGEIISKEGKGFITARKDISETYIDSVGANSAFKRFDELVGIGDKKFKYFDEFTDELKENKGKTIDVIVRRDGKELVVSTKVDNDGKIGFNKTIFVSSNYEFKNAKIDEIEENSAAEKAGIEFGDIITGVNNLPINNIKDFKQFVSNNKNEKINIGVIRDGVANSITATVSKKGKLGIDFDDKTAEKKYTKINDLSFGQAVPAAVKESWALLVYNVKQFKLILRPKTEAYKHVQSPIGIARRLPDTWNWEFIWNFTALFSIGLAFMNLLPIPGLDGGHALFTIVEMITGRKLSDKAAGYVQTAGMIILLTLMALTFGKDIYQLVVDKLL